VTPRTGPRRRDMVNIDNGQKASLINGFPPEARLYAAVISQAKLDSQKFGQLGQRARDWLAGEDQGGLTVRECWDAIAAFRPRERTGARLSLSNVGNSLDTPKAAA
jgi:hypothetical protein